MQVNFRYLLTISLVTALGGLLFGFDISVISGTIPFLREFFGLNETMKGWVVSSALIGCILGASYSGRLGDRFGRKKILLITAVLFGISAIGSGFSSTIPGFVFYRILGGLCTGLHCRGFAGTPPGQDGFHQPAHHRNWHFPCLLLQLVSAGDWRKCLALDVCGRSSAVAAVFCRLVHHSRESALAGCPG